MGVASLSTTSEPTTHERGWMRGLIAGVLWALLVVALVRLGHDHGRADGHHHGTASIAPGRTFASWLTMTAVMMLPTSLPVVRALGDLLGNRSDVRRRSAHLVWWSFLIGYVAVWSLYAVIAASLQVALARSGLLGESGELRSSAVSGSVLLVAAAYQFSSWKQACLSGCTRPMTFFLVHWREGASGGLRMGARHAVTCIGCCWALMALAFVGGVHSIWFMVIATVLMVIEKLPSVGERARVPIGVLLALGAVSVWWGWFG
jgi:predicted metal-binding membrane protein